MEERYFSPQKTAEVTGININQIKQLVIAGQLHIYVPDGLTGKCLQEPLNRYAAVQFFNNPDSQQSILCNIWKRTDLPYEGCPDDCEYKINNAGRCGPIPESVIADVHFPIISLDQLIILDSDLHIIEDSFMTPAQAYDQQLKRKQSEAANMVDELRKRGKSNGEIRDKLKSMFGRQLTNVEIHDLICPGDSRKNKTAKIKKVQRMK